MFETEDGIVNVDSLSLEDQIVFFERYPNAKLVKEEDLKIVARENPTAAKPSDMQFGSDVEEIKLKSDVDMAKIREDVRVAEIRTTKPKSIELEEFEEIYEEDRDKRINEFRQAEFYASRDSNVIPTQDGYVIGEASKDQFGNDETWKDYQKWVESGRIETYDELDLDFQIEKQYELNDLNIDLDKTNIYYNPQKNTSFVDTYYDAELLKKMNVNIDDFQGLLNKKGLTEDFNKKINRGTFDEKSVEQGKRENLLLSKEIFLSTYLDIYLNEIDEKANKKAFIEEYNYSKNKYKDFETFDEAYSSFIKEKGGKFTTFNLDAYTEYQTKALPNLSKAAKQLDKDQALLMDKRSKQSNAEGAVRGLGETGYGFGATFVSGAKEFKMWLNDIFPTPISTKVNEQKRLIQIAEQYKDAKNKLQYMNVSGKSVDYNGVNYLKDDNGTLYNTTTGLTVGESIGNEEKQKISDKIDKEGVDDFDFSLRGFSNFAGAVLGDVAFQILGTKGLTGARLAASTKYLAKANGFKNVAQFKNFQKLAYMPKVKNAGTFGVKLPMDARYIDAAFAQGVQGAFRGYNSTLLEAKRAGLTDSEAEKLANSASLQLGVLYTLTGPINPKLPMINKLDDWLLGKNVINEAIKNYTKAGSKKAFNESLGQSIKKLIPTKRSAIRVFNEGFKEFGQEDIQQRAENFVVNRSINDEAGIELLKADYSVDDFIGTGVLSFSIGSLTSGGLRIPGFKSNPHARLRNLYEVSLNLEKSKKMLAIAVDKGTISQEVAEDIINQATAVGLGLKKAPSFMASTPELMIEWSQKYSELQEELKKKEDLHESAHDFIDQNIQQIQGELKNIVSTADRELAAQNIAEQAETVRKIQKKFKTGVETVVLKSDNDFKENNITRQEVGNALFKKVEGVIYINLDQAAANFDIAAPTHELLHQIISQEFSSKDGELDPRVKKAVDEFKQVLKDKGVFNKVDDRMKAYRNKADDIRREGQDKGLSEAEIQVKIKEFGGLDIDNVDSDEWITQFFSLVSEGEIKFDKLGEKTWLQIGKEILETLAVKLGINTDKLKFNSGQEVFDFVLDYEKAISKGKLTAKARRGLKDFKKDKGEKRSLSLLEDINNLVPKNVKTKEEFLDRKVFNAVFQSTQKSVEPKNKLKETNVGSFLAKKDPSILKTIGSAKPNEQILKVVKSLIKDESSTVLTQQEIDRALELVDKDISEIKSGAIYNYIMSREASSEEKNIMLDRVRERLINYDPTAVRKTKSGEPITFGEFLFANTAFSQRDAKKKLAIDSERTAESLDTEEARQVAEPVAETTTTEDPRVEYQNLVEASVLPAKMVTKMKEKMLLVTKTLKSRIDAAVSKNKTVTPLMSEIKKEMGVQADILFKKVLGAKRGGELRNNLLKLKKPILENMTTTWLQGAMPFAIQKSVDGKFIDFPDWQGKNIDRENVNTYKAGRTDGKPIVRRLPNAANKIGDSQFLTYMFDSNGDVVRGAKESLSKALAQEYAIDMYNKELKDSNSEIRKAFVDNQEMLGTVLADNFIQEFSRQSERGSVKRSISDISNTIDTYRTALELHINGDIDGADTLIKSLSKEDQEGWEVITGYLSAKNYKYKKNLENLDAPSNVRGILETYFANKSDRDNDVAMKQMYDFSSSLIDALPNSLVKALGSDFFGVHFRYLNPKQKNSYGDKIREKIKSLDATDTDIGLEVNDIRLVQAGSGIVLKITNNILNKKFKSADEKIKQFESKYGDEVRALNSANSKAIETVFSTVFDLAIEKPQQAVGFLRMLESTTNIAKSLRALTGIIDIQMTAESQAVYINKKTGQGYTNTANKSKAKEIESGEVVINTKHPNYKQALEFIKKGSKQSIDQLLRIKGEHAKPSSNFNSEAAINLIESLSIAINNPGNIAKVKQAFLFNLKNSLQGFNQQLNTKVLSDIQDAKLGTTSDIGEARLLAVSKKDLDSFYDISGTQRVGKINRDILGIFNKSAVEKISKLSTIQKAIDNSRKRSYSENPKGISVYDFDDTLAFSKSQIIVKKDGKTFKINAAQFAKQGETLLAEGAEFDFSEFNKVVKGQAGPLIPRIQKAIDKFGNKNIFILTARPVASETAIHAFMKGLGIDIPRANITGLANSTAQAKADWMVGKVAEGFNDFYFVDDAIKNVQAVKDVLETFDVNSKVQQAIANRKRSMSSDLNKMIERNKGVRAETTYSKVLARKKGAKKGKFKFFVPYSAEDFKGLTSYTLAGKGKQGEADQKLFDETLILPYTRGIAAMEGATQALKNDYKNLLDMFGLKKELPKKIGDTDFTTDQAVRVYLWDQQGFDIPNISKRDQNKLSSLVSKDPDLVGFAEGLMAVSKKDNWVNPKEHWDVGSILKDLNDITDNVNRKEYLAEFIENVDEMFDKTTLNKLEAIYGTNYVEALQDSIRRMKSGSNTPRSAGKIEQKWLNWVNNSVGTIMFFNRRSALLQMLSFTNFINWSDNNPAKAAAAFANQPLYWKKWTEIFNSDKLKERRGGLKSDIQESEIANQARNSKDKASAVVSYLLKIGFTPTQIADSFAIATGGATFLINRTKKYEKQGLSKKEAEAKAFEDFGRISDETQQSGDPMLISQQQSSHLGRLILAFQNTPMQYTRLMKKAGKDIINRRGSDVENLSKIAYYGFVQNLIFSSLQSALFALIPGFDDEEEDDAKLEDKAIRTANSMVDTILRGSGLAGAVVSTLKNAIMRYKKEDEKGFTADQTYTMLELANISPPIGSKLRKVYSAIQTKKFNQAVIDEMGYDLTIDGKFNPSPNYEIIANISSAVANIPADRLLSEIKSINEAFDSRNTSYQRLALALGWRTWDVNVKNEEQDIIKVVSKIIKKEIAAEKRKKEREAKKRLKQSLIK